MEVDAFQKSEYVPEIDKNYKFDKDTTIAIISGLLSIKEFWFKDIMAPESQRILNK